MPLDDVTTRFFNWTAAKGLKNGEIARLLVISDPNTISAYKSRGLPRSKFARAEALMAEDGQPIDDQQIEDLAHGDQLTLRPSENEFDAWTAAFKNSPYSTLKEWAVNGLNDLANLSAEEPIRNVIPIDQPPADNIIAFPEIPLHHAAAGSPVTSDGDTYEPSKDYGPGRFAVKLHGTSMEPTYRDGSIVILREKESLKRPVLKKGEAYLFIVNGEKCLKVYDARNASQEEIEAGISYDGTTGKPKVRILRSINPEFSEIVLSDSDEVEWLGWLDPSDNK